MPGYRRSWNVNYWKASSVPDLVSAHSSEHDDPLKEIAKWREAWRA